MLQRVVLILGLCACLVITGCVVGFVRDKDSKPAEFTSPTFTAQSIPTHTSSSPPIEIAPTPTPQPDSPTNTPIPTQAPPIATSSPPSIDGPRIISFAAERIKTSRGERVLLTWEAVGKSANICPLINLSKVTCKCFDVPLTGSRTLAGDEIIANYSSFLLDVREANEMAVAQVYIQLQKACLFDWFFDTAPAPQICPGDQPLHSLAVAQRFEHGLMIWVKALGQYFILFDDGKILKIVTDPLELKPGASPDNRVDETPPDGYYEPVSGFGLIWRGEVADTANVRERLEWATQAEFEFETIYQCQAECGHYWNCYLYSADDSVLHFDYLRGFGYYWDQINEP